jgi:hypothetical protein
VKERKKISKELQPSCLKLKAMKDRFFCTKPNRLHHDNAKVRRHVRAKRRCNSWAASSDEQFFQKSAFWVLSAAELC